MAKYTRRERKPGGGWRYYYDKPGQGPQQGGGKQHEPHGGSDASRMLDPSNWSRGEARTHHAVGGPLSSRGRGAPKIKSHVYEASGGTYIIAMQSYGWGATFYPGRTHKQVKATQKRNAQRVKAAGYTGRPAGETPGYESLNAQRPTESGEPYDRRKHGPAVGLHTAFGPNVEDAMAAASKHAARTTRKSMTHINPLDLVKGNITLEEAGLAKGEGQTVSAEISHLVRDKGYPQKRAVAAALEQERRGKIAKGDEEEGEESEEEEEEDPAEAEAKKEEEAGKSMRGLSSLDLVKAQPPTPQTMRIGSVTYHMAPAQTLDPIGSRPSLPRLREPAHEAVEREVVDPLELVRMPGGVLTHPNGRTRVDDGRD